jgi:hypothetical protein
VHRPPLPSKSRLALSLSTALLGATGCFGASSASSPSGPASDAASMDGPAPAFDAGVPDSGPAVAFDGGPGCLPLTAQGGLSPSAEGLPADGLVLWLRSDQGVYAAPSDGGPASTDAGTIAAVCAWADVSGNGWVLQNQTGMLPTWQPAGVGGDRPSIEFASTMEALQTSGVLGISPTSPRTLIAVDSLINTDGRFEPIAQGQTGSPGTYLMIDENPYETTGNLEGVYMTSNAFDTALATVAFGTNVHIYTISAMTIGTPIVDSVEYRVNGAPQTLTLLPGGSDGTFQDFSAANFTAVGASFTSSTGAGPDARVAEVLVYDRALSVAERASVQSTLAGRYAPGIQ